MNSVPVFEFEITLEKDIDYFEVIPILESSFRIKLTLAHAQLIIVARTTEKPFYLNQFIRTIPIERGISEADRQEGGVYLRSGNGHNYYTLTEDGICSRPGGHYDGISLDELKLYDLGSIPSVRIDFSEIPDVLRTQDIQEFQFNVLPKLLKHHLLRGNVIQAEWKLSMGY